MPKISLVVCLYKERAFLERLLLNARDCYDELIVVHDGVEDGEKMSDEFQTVSYARGWNSPKELSLSDPGAPPKELAIDYATLPSDSPIPTGYRLSADAPKPGSIHDLVVRYGGRFYEGPRCFQQEPHWPFAWWSAKYNWILRLDADEFPSEELRNWIFKFRMGKEEFSPSPSGFLSIWTQWDGKKELPPGDHANRLFLFDKSLVRYFGMAENTPEIESQVIPLKLLLHHRPNRPSFGLSNLFLRKQYGIWKKVIATSLLGSPLQLPRWRYSASEWTPHWRYIRDHPFSKIFLSLSLGPLRDLKNAFITGRPIRLNDVMASMLHQSMMAYTYLRLRKSKGKNS